jgi:hypothetical protein
MALYHSIHRGAWRQIRRWRIRAGVDRGGREASGSVLGAGAGTRDERRGGTRDLRVRFVE